MKYRKYICLTSERRTQQITWLIWNLNVDLCINKLSFRVFPEGLGEITE